MKLTGAYASPLTQYVFECGRAACPHDFICRLQSVWHFNMGKTVVPVSRSHLSPPPFTYHYFPFTTSTTHTCAD